MIPSLAALPLFPRKDLEKPRNEKSDVPSGRYCLDTRGELEPCESSILLVRNALKAPEGAFAEMQSFMRDKVRQDTFMGNKVPRKQATFAPSKYKAYELFSDPEQWPRLVTLALRHTQELATVMEIPNPMEYSGVHANFYADGDNSVAKHADDENQLMRDENGDVFPIFSYTFLLNDDDSGARDFTVWRKSGAANAHIEPNVKGQSRLLDVTLRSGDLIVMQGKMQRHFDHSIEKTPADAAMPRINITVRKFTAKSR